MPTTGNDFLDSGWWLPKVGKKSLSMIADQSLIGCTCINRVTLTNTLEGFRGFRRSSNGFRWSEINLFWRIMTDWFGTGWRLVPALNSPNWNFKALFSLIYKKARKWISWSSGIQLKLQYRSLWKRCFTYLLFIALSKLWIKIPLNACSFFHPDRSLVMQLIYI